ncbi:glutathionyl-hydroquinone reductase [Malassezia cuniculi]|uniref:Glutathionyl-hydroquinone reductase n=1 Tax=Malassezia cuniculi TaxID=948313 RepID=A0AAF0ETB1_9BASI|nr:glutathionyl-hydroquinone reductase [Malassezia cuniculi]
MSTTTTTMPDIWKFSSKDGRFHRQVASFRDEIAKGGKFEPEVGRYHLIVALACPWAHRTLILRKLKGIDKVEGLLPVTVVDSFLGPDGWTFVPYENNYTNVPGTGNHIPGEEDKTRIRDFYLAAEPEYTARYTVPVIWDNKLKTIVSNESSEIIRFLNTCFDEFLPEEFRGVTFYPEELRSEIDEMNELVYPNVNNGVYKAGFAATKEAYEENIPPLFETLHKLDKHLEGRDYLIGDRLTEADVRLYTTIVRFDPVYFCHFKCNVNLIRDGAFPNLHRWLRTLYWKNDAFKSTTNFESIKAHYFGSHISLNPTGIVPAGPLPHILPL